MCVRDCVKQARLRARDLQRIEDEAWDFFGGPKGRRASQSGVSANLSVYAGAGGGSGLEYGVHHQEEAQQHGVRTTAHLLLDGGHAKQPV